MADLLKYSVLTVFLLFGASGSPVHAFRIVTEGGPKIQSDDGNVELGFNARAHLDVHWFNQNNVDPRFPPFGSQILGAEEGSGFNWRRTYTTLTGRFYRLNFKFENDFAVVGDFPHTLRETWVSTKIGSGLVTIGQFKPYRGLEELTSSNEITFMERPSTSSTGIYNGRQFLMGMGYKNTIGDKFGFGVDVMSLAHMGLPIEGLTYGGRLVWLPVSDENTTMHFGFAFSRDQANAESLSANAVDIYGGRQGIRKSLGTAGAGIASGSSTQTTFAAEVAYAIGPVTVQGEYAKVRLDNTHLVGGTQKDSTVQAYYVQASWFVTGERALYRKDRGTFGKPKPIGKWGALELAVRYDLAENTTQSLIADPCRTGTSKCHVEVITLGANWYVRPGLRFMLNYYVTEASIGNAGTGTANRKDEPYVVSFRTQLSF